MKDTINKNKTVTIKTVSVPVWSNNFYVWKVNDPSFEFGPNNFFNTVGIWLKDLSAIQMVKISQLVEGSVNQIEF